MNEIMMIHSFISILKMNLWTFFFYFHFGSFGCLCDIIAVALVCFHGFFSEANFLEETQLNQKILLFLAVVLLVFLDPLCLAVIKAKNSFPFLCLWRSLVCLVFFSSGCCGSALSWLWRATSSFWFQKTSSMRITWKLA